MIARIGFIVLLISMLSNAANAEDPILERSPVKTIYLLNLSHLDIGFTDTQAAVAKISAETIDRAIQLCAEYPDFKWTIESIWQLEQWMKGKSPDQIEQLISLVRSGRIGLTAMYAGMHSARMSAEEVCRSMYFAERLRREYGVKINTAIQNDVPGFSWAYPQAMRKSGVKYFAAGINAFIGAGAEIPVKDRPFLWEGPDGSRILTFICQDPGIKESGYVLGLWEYKWGPGGRAEETVPDLLNRLEKDGYPYDSILVMAASGDNCGAFPGMTEGAREWNAKHPTPKMEIISTPDEFFEHVESKYAGKFPVYRGDWSGLWDQIGDGLPYGVGLVRGVQSELPDAEALSSAADALGLRAYPKSDLDSAWRNLIVYDEHSGGGGWPGTVTAEQTTIGDRAKLEYAKAARRGTSSAMRKSLSALSEAVKTTGDGIVVWNTLASERSAFVRLRLDEERFNKDFALLDPAGKPIAFQKIKPTREIIFRAENVPSLGYRTFTFRTPTSPNLQSAICNLQSSCRLLENDLLRIEVGDDGLVKSILDKRTGIELVDPKARDGFCSLVSNSKESIPSGTPSVSVGLTGPLAGSLIITDPKSPLARTEITLYAGSPVVHFRHTFDLRRTPHASESVAYDIAYPLSIPDAELTFDTPAGMLNPKTDLMPKAFNIIVLQRGGDITGSGRGITLASKQAFMWEFGQPNRVWGTPIPPESTCLMMRLLSKSDVGHYKEGIGPREVEPGAPKSLTYETAFLIHGGSASSEIEAFLSSEATPLIPALVSPNPKGRLPAGSGRLLALDAPNTRILALKKAENGGGFVLRLMETGGKTGAICIKSGVLRVRSAELLDIVENPIHKLPVKDGCIVLQIKPREIVTLRLGLSEEAK